MDQNWSWYIKAKDIDITTGRNIVDSDFELQAMEFEKEMEQRNQLCTDLSISGADMIRNLYDFDDMMHVYEVR